MSSDVTLKADLAEDRKAKPFTRRIPGIARILMGLPLIVFGLNGFGKFWERTNPPPDCLDVPYSPVRPSK